MGRGGVPVPTMAWKKIQSFNKGSRLWIQSMGKRRLSSGTNLVTQKSYSKYTEKRNEKKKDNRNPLKKRFRYFKVTTNEID